MSRTSQRPWEWTTPEPVTRRDQVLARQRADPPNGAHNTDGLGHPRGRATERDDQDQAEAGEQCTSG
jgi:hypothetical protein